MPKVKKDTYYLIFVFMIIFCIYRYGIGKLCGFSIYPDEFGYWASAAKAVGYNWSEVASLGSYYSFGYSLILIPILKLFHGGVSAYRAAIAVNVIFMCLGMLLLRDIMKRIFPNASPIKKNFICGIAVMYPPWIFYTQMTLAESLLMLLFILICWLLVCFIQKPKVITAVTLAVTLIYTYSVHMRTVAIVVACIITMIFWGISKPSIKKKMMLFLAVIGIASIAMLMIKRNVIMEVFTYADTDSLSVNDYGSQWKKILQILSWQGFAELIVEIIGKLFYLGLASFGMLYWALSWSIKEIISIFKRSIKKQTCYIQSWIALFLFLSLFGEVLISSIYMHGSLKVDCLIYGRYTEFLIPVFLIFGIAAMYRSRYLMRRTVIYGILTGLCIPVLLLYINKKQMKGIRGYFVPGISSFLNEENFIPAQFFLKSWLWCLIIMVIMAFFIFVSKHFRGAEWILAGVLIIEIIMGFCINSHYTYAINEVIFPDLLISEVIKKEADVVDEVLYLDEDIPEFIDFLQMQLPEISIKVIGEDKLEQLCEQECFLVVYRESKYQELLKKNFDRMIFSPTFILYYNENSVNE